MAPNGGFPLDEVLDSDTGEMVTGTVTYCPPRTRGDSETGEQAQLRLVYQRSKFRVPRSALKVPVFDSAVQNSSKKDSESSYDLTLLVLPLLVILPGWATVLYIMLEMGYHSWSHSHEGDHVPCKTPMRLLFKASCAECVSRNQMQKVGKLQDQRTLRINSRRILNYDYAQFGLSCLN